MGEKGVYREKEKIEREEGVTEKWIGIKYSNLMGRREWKIEN